MDGNLLRVRSAKNWSKKEFFSELALLGPYSVVACDTATPSRFAKHVASVFGCKLFAPKHSLSVWEKVSLADCDGLNSHERDALAAARKAYHCVAENKIRQFKRISKGNATPKQKAMVLSGVRMREFFRR